MDAPVTPRPYVPEREPWAAPDLSVLRSSKRVPPRLDLAAFGPALAGWIDEAAAAVSAPADYVAASLLSSAGAMLANVRRPRAGAEWSEPPLLWLALVGRPSAGKSPAIRIATAPLDDIESRWAASHEAALRAFEAEKVAARAARTAWEAEAEALAAEGCSPVPTPRAAIPPVDPTRERIVVSDATTEKLAALAADNPRGLLRLCDELAGWLESFGRYGGGGTDRAFALQCFDGGSYRLDRVKHPLPIAIPHLSIGVLGGIQPDRLEPLFAAPDDGLVSRFLWCWPDPVDGFTLARKAIDSAVPWYALSRLAELPLDRAGDGSPCPRAVPLSTAAERLFEDFVREVKRVASESSALTAGTLGKAGGHALRLAAVVEFLRWAAGESGREPAEIGEESTAAACALMGNYFLPMAECVFGDAAVPRSERLAAILARRLKAERLPNFNARDFRRRVGGPLGKAEAMDAACAELQDAGIIRRVDEGASAGRKRKAFEVNPMFFTES